MVIDRYDKRYSQQFSFIVFHQGQKFSTGGSLYDLTRLLFGKTIFLFEDLVFFYPTTHYKKFILVFFHEALAVTW